MNYEVKGERIVVRPDEKPSHIGSIVVAESVAMIPTCGTIVQVGDEITNYQAGMRVAFAERAGALARIGDDLVRFLDPSEILCIIPKHANS